MELKRYQKDTLATLQRFLEEARVGGPEAAYQAITSEPEQSQRLGRYRDAYKSLEALPDTPYVCLRLPTGGGKTLLGTHAVDVTRRAWVEQDHPMALWLTPTNTIRQQTVEALKNASHPYRQALDEAFEGRVRVFDITDFSGITPQDIRDHCCVVVGTIQTLRTSTMDGRKVYAHHEDLEPHFATLSSTADGLEALEGGGVKYSFANLMHLHRPIMIVDEAHNAVTGLTREMQARVNPSVIIEFTATPRTNSNILHSVSAQELSAEEMIKLPIMLSEHSTWQNAVNSAIATRAMLTKKAESDSNYIRPIILFQAQPEDQDVTVGALKQHLIEVEQVPEEQIAVATGKQRELDGIDLFDPNCPIEYVITVEALKEGWDCSFAYVFCSVSRIRSAPDVEQLLGRVLRMPYAKRRHSPELSKAYAHLSEPTFGEAARSLVDKLVNMGFEEGEAEDIVEQLPVPTNFGPLEPAGPMPTFIQTVTGGKQTLSELGDIEGVSIHQTPEGGVQITVAGAIDDNLEEAIVSEVPEEEKNRIAEAIATYRAKTADSMSPAERGDSFSIPGLVSELQGELMLAETEVFLEFHDWSLLDHSPKLDETEFRIQEVSNTFEIYLDGRHVAQRFAGQQEQINLEINIDGWTPQALVLWLDRQVRQADVQQSELIGWLSDLVKHLIDDRRMHISTLMHCKYILARRIRDKLNDIRRNERDSAYQRCLFAPEAHVEVSFDHAFTFTADMYASVARYRGSWTFNNHYLGPKLVPAFDGAEGGEEFQCAQALDLLPGVKHWIRNVARHENSFWLPVSNGRFYPDFVAQLEDGRLLVVEYKGAHIVDGRDTLEKRAIGQLWEEMSNGTGLFLIVEKEVDGMGMQAQIAGKLISGA